MWNESDEAKQIQKDIDHYHNEKANEDSAADKSPDSGRNYASSFGTQLTVVTKRVFQNYNRDTTCAYRIPSIALCSSILRPPLLITLDLIRCHLEDPAQHFRWSLHRFLLLGLP